MLLVDGEEIAKLLKINDFPCQFSLLARSPTVYGSDAPEKTGKGER
jgi:hypothetical protein